MFSAGRILCLDPVGVSGLRGEMEGGEEEEEEDRTQGGGAGLGRGGGGVPKVDGVLI